MDVAQPERLAVVLGNLLQDGQDGGPFGRLGSLCRPVRLDGQLPLTAVGLENIAHGHGNVLRRWRGVIVFEEFGPGGGCAVDPRLQVDVAGWVLRFRLRVGDAFDGVEVGQPAAGEIQANAVVFGEVLRVVKSKPSGAE